MKKVVNVNVIVFDSFKDKTVTNKQTTFFVTGLRNLEFVKGNLVSNMAIPVMEFSREVYKIRKVFG